MTAKAHEKRVGGPFSPSHIGFWPVTLPQIMASQFLQPGRSSAAMVIEELVESAVERAYEAVKYLRVPTKRFWSFCVVLGLCRTQIRL
jgi:hypothetical protein